MFDNETLRTIKQRKSIRDYKNKQISDDELKVILEAGIYAPNGSGQLEDYIHFAVIKNKNVLNKINNFAKEFAKQSEMEWLKNYGNEPNFNCLYNEDWIQPEIDCAAATQNILLAAESIGLGGCWLFFPLQAFYSEHGKKLLNELKIPDGYRPITSMIIGYKADEKINIPQREIKNISYIK
ncbi:MAG: nitroreductase family protein [Treponema sp.]|jgi:nitroreductase|nr:nitroreductase family protein [Treponema sp.]